jgi:translation initiation factor 3 subunit C
VRLADEASLIELSKFIFQYYERVGDKGSAALVALVNVEHVYYKHNIVDMAVQRAHAFTSKWGRLADVHPALTSKQVLVSDSGRDASKMHPATYQGYPQVDVEVADPANTLNELCQYIFKHGDERTKSRALLCSVFHHALHDRFHKARDLFLISHIQDVVDKVDTKTQILFNRTLATLGLSAFRAGLIQKAHDCLSGICSGRPMQVKELLAQGTSRWGPDRDPEQERLEKRRQMPYHMHINHDLLDCCYLTCAMLLELPSIAAKQYPRAGAGAFRKYFQTYSRQIFTGPPENTREHVMAASKALLKGEWQKGANYILGMDVWNLIPNEGGAKVKEMLHGRIKDEAIRTYLLSSVVSAYGSISLDHLCESFEMDGTTVKRIVSKMIFNKEMNAAWDEDTLIIQKNEVSSLQQLSVRVADKVNQLTESNERLLDPLNGGQMFGLSDQWQDNRGYRKGGQWQDNRSGGNRWAKSGASGRGEYRGNRNDGQRRHQHQHRDQHQHQHQRRDGGGGRGGHHGGDRGHGGGNGGYNREREASEKPKMAWNAVSNEAK